MGVAVEVNLGVLSLPREQFICLADSILLHIECEDAAAFPRKLAEQRRVAAPCRLLHRCTDCPGALSDAENRAQWIMYSLKSSDDFAVFIIRHSSIAVKS